MKGRILTGSVPRPLSLVAVAFALGAASACVEPSSSPTSGGQVTSASAAREAAGVGDEIGQLRAATARFHDIEAAKDAEYVVALTGCYVDEIGGRGAMGFHFGKGSAINNPTVNQLEPEALLYEPQKNGRLRLVGVEFLVPYTLVPRSSPTPPTAFGQTFKQNDTFQVWALHVWAWKNNPSGIFADWNPDVTCAHAPPAASRSSHAH
jgi:hypothetical protein